MNKQEAQDQMKKLQQEINKLQEIIDRPDITRWKPLNQENYYYIDSYGDILKNCWDDNNRCNYRWKQRNVFKTEELAKDARKAQDIQTRYFELAEASWEGEEVNWTNDSQSKYFHEVCEETNLKHDYCRTNKRKQNKYYFKTQETLEQSRREIGAKNIIKYVLEDIN